MKSRSNASPVWVSLLALSLVGSLSVPAYCDSVTLPPGTGPQTLVTQVEAILSIVQTNAWIVSDFNAYSNDVYGVILPALEGLRSEVNLSNASSASRYIYEIGESLLQSSDPDAVQAGQRLLDYSGFWTYAYTTLSQSIAKVEEDFALVQNQQILKSATMEMDQSVPESSGGSCECPDYTGLLTRIASFTEAIRDNTQWIVDFIGVAIARGLQVSNESDQWAVGLALGERISWLRVLSDQLALMSRPLNSSLSDPVSEADYGQVGTRAGVVLSAWSRMLERSDGDDDDPLHPRWSMVDAWRYRWMDTWYVFPTNTPSRPLHVTVEDNVDSQRFWLTNRFDVRVDMGDDDLIVEIGDTSITNLIAMLTNATLRVAITNDQNQYQQMAEANVQVEINEGNQLMGNPADPPDISADLPEPDWNFLRDIRSWFDGISETYQKLLEDRISSETPRYIVFYEGYTRDASSGLDIPEYSTMIDSDLLTFLTIVRSMFGLFWVLTGLWVARYLISHLVNLLVLGYRVVVAFAIGNRQDLSDATIGYIKSWLQALGLNLWPPAN